MRWKREEIACVVGMLLISGIMFYAGYVTAVIRLSQRVPAVAALMQRP